MTRKTTLWLLASLLTSTGGATDASDSAPFIPLDLMRGTSPVVDDPIGARSSLGLTLWHMGHDADQISGFHEFLRKHDIQPESLVPAGVKLPNTVSRILIEPERLPADQMNGWAAREGYLVSGAWDAGPSVDLPLHVERAGLYTGWVRFFGSSAGTGVTGLRIYRAGHEAAGPIVNDEIYDYAVEMDGKNWKHFMVDLVPGDYILRLSHVTRLWHAGKAPAGYADRSIDLLYFTDEIWEDAPSDATLQTLRDAGAPADLQMSAQPALDARGEERRRLWQVRPLSWEDSQTQPRLFALSREYWRQQIDALGNKDYGTEVPDYRVPERQIVFDDDWNLVANPVQIRRRIDALNSDILTRPSPHFSYWLQAGDFQKFEAEWARYGTGMIATYGDFNGSASTDFPVDQPGEYTVWAHFRLLNAYYAPWRVTATNPAGEKLSWDHDAKEYPSEWQKIGVLKMDRVGIVHFEIDPLGFQNPGTYRIIYDFLLTTDADYVPQGDVRPPLNLSQYNARAHASGATGKDAYLIWIFDNAYTPLVQEVGSDNSWPLPTVQALVVKEPIVPSITRKLVMPSCTQRAVQIGLRSLRDKPIKLHVGCGDLKGAEGDFPGKVSWRVVGFVPQNESTRDFHDQAVDVVHDARLVGQEPRLAQPDL